LGVELRGKEGREKERREDDEPALIKNQRVGVVSR
jgi:hypothetical protein